MDKRSGSQIDYTWECLENGKEDCFHKLGIPVKVNDTHYSMTIKENTLKIGHNYTFTFKVWDNRRLVRNVEKSDNFKNLTFVIAKDLTRILKDLTFLKENCLKA
ncbi:UNVERIFIED_CONTAM: hypothetical protein RMT77_016335 [Armadillidium vulgare]